MLLKYYMTVRLLAEHHLEFLSLKGGCTLLEITCHGSNINMQLHVVDKWAYRETKVCFWQDRTFEII